MLRDLLRIFLPYYLYKSPKFSDILAARSTSSPSEEPLPRSYLHLLARPLGVGPGPKRKLPFVNARRIRLWTFIPIRSGEGATRKHSGPGRGAEDGQEVLGEVERVGGGGGARDVARGLAAPERDGTAATSPRHDRRAPGCVPRGQLDPGALLAVLDAVAVDTLESLSDLHQGLEGIFKGKPQLDHEELDSQALTQVRGIR